MIMPALQSTRSESSRASKIMSAFSGIGLGKERDYVIENLSMLISCGMPISSALDSIVTETRSGRLKALLAEVKADIDSGSPLWRALDATPLFPEHAVSLVRLGEESGKLAENLRVVAMEREKNRVFKSKLRSAVMYPVFVLGVTVVIGVGIAWFILPKLATVFSQMNIELPLITKILIAAGTYLSKYGFVIVPVCICITAAISYVVFVLPRTKFIGQRILFMLPGIHGLIKEVEIARFGYLLGTLLQAGLPITQALDSLARATTIAQYQALFSHLRDSVDSGDSIQRSFSSFVGSTRLVPSPIQQLIFAGEQSGTLAQTLKKVGETYEAKADTTTKNLTVILEPVLLVIVWLGVVAVAMAVILPIYSLIGGFKTS
jgi:type IV pilus assembly protein PilC